MIFRAVRMLEDLYVLPFVLFANQSLISQTADDRRPVKVNQ